MSVATLTPGRIVIDDSFNPPVRSQMLRAVGLVVAELRYSSQPDANRKNWNRDQIAERAALGFAMQMIHEQQQTDHIGGAKAGRLKADVHARYAAQIGWPLDLVPALVACDSSPTAELADYAGAFEERIIQLGAPSAGAYVFGPDGVQMLVDNQVCTSLMWQASAGAQITGITYADAVVQAKRRWPYVTYFEPVAGTVRTTAAVHPQAHLFQRVGYRSLATGPFAPGQVDENLVMRSCQFWLPVGALPSPGPVLPPIPLPDPFPQIPTNVNEGDDEMLVMFMFPERPGDVFMGHITQAGKISSGRSMSIPQVQAYDGPDMYQVPADRRAPGWGEHNVLLLDEGAYAMVDVGQFTPAHTHDDRYPFKAHAHGEYSTTAHQHPELATQAHAHVGYAPSAHQHPVGPVPAHNHPHQHPSAG